MTPRVPFDEEALRAAAVSGDAAARENVMRHLYEALSGKLYVLCHGITRDPSDAQDAVQETFLSIQRALPQFRGDAQLSTWAYRIAVRAAVAAKARRERHRGDAVDIEMADPRARIEETFETRERKRRLEVAMRTLSLEHRTVLSLFAVEGLSHAQIASVLGIPEGTAWSRLHLARKRLAAALESTAP
ncbi:MULTISPECIES: RNA polymerase sigma factor [Myxococcus]|uniref:RNA polymerase subunit sigma n=1 Tax=Myxococcus xanthus TaxID=34 RepID=A0AAE6FX46_MYXXA|nr:MULTISPECIES: sigma-70 family RNA polymerase sigma factor [Myxococcus]QDE67003.1 RNA polymerase subunit sigma [Myxococcus xanthus]QDE74276.1 RNA polymerase subunit sigma [Myxococcus xanthus]QDF03188.1 RNA polymerase subunit sigma [Myxococcus xanthus]WAM28113.1 sigma-70 family RNA polymerase sigma factor [Myxococcus sp. NMCA1]